MSLFIIPCTRKQGLAVWYLDCLDRQLLHHIKGLTNLSCQPQCRRSTDSAASSLSVLDAVTVISFELFICQNFHSGCTIAHLVMWKWWYLSKEVLLWQLSDTVTHNSLYNCSVRYKYEHILPVKIVLFWNSKPAALPDCHFWHRIPNNVILVSLIY